MLLAYDVDKNYIGAIGRYSGDAHLRQTPSNALYVRLNTYISALEAQVLNIHKTNGKDGEYEPFKRQSYPLDNDVVLRGLFKLDASNNLYANGDIYKSNGDVNRRYAIRAYQSGDSTDGTTMITDGVNTVYLLDTALTESAEPYQDPQKVDPYGTEEYVVTDGAMIPIGHETEYQVSAT